MFISIEIKVATEEFCLKRLLSFVVKRPDPKKAYSLVIYNGEILLKAGLLGMSMRSELGQVEVEEPGLSYIFEKDSFSFFWA